MRKLRFARFFGNAHRKRSDTSHVNPHRSSPESRIGDKRKLYRMSISLIGEITPTPSAELKTVPADRVSYVLIGEDADGQRLDNFLFRIAKGVPKGHVYRVIRAGEVRVSKKRAKAETKHHAGRCCADSADARCAKTSGHAACCAARSRSAPRTLRGPAYPYRAQTRRHCSSRRFGHFIWTD